MSDDKRRENAAVEALMALPPLAMLRTGETRWSMVMPMDVEIFGYGTQTAALGEVFHLETFPQ